MTVGVVRNWAEERGWGVLESEETPGGCCAGFGMIEEQGYRALTPGERVSFAWTPRPQHLALTLTYPFRAVRVLRDGGRAAGSSPRPKQP